MNKFLLVSVVWPLWITHAWHASGYHFHSRYRRSSSTPSSSLLQQSHSSDDLRDEDTGKKVVQSNQLLNNAYKTGQTSYSAALDEKGYFLSRMLSPRPLPVEKTDDEENEDGWSDMRRVKRWKKVAKLPAKVFNKLIFDKPFQEPGTLILVRHGESTWNANQTFTGWSDYSDLSERGRREVEHAARLLLEGGYEIDVVFTSRLKRAIRSAWIMMEEMNELYLPVFKSWRLNERHYGALTGLNKKETAEMLGHDVVQEWRGSLNDLSVEQLPLTESLADCMERTAPIWEKKILYELRNGKNVMVVGKLRIWFLFVYAILRPLVTYAIRSQLVSNIVCLFCSAHANTLRGLVKTIDRISDDDIQNIAIPTVGRLRCF